MLVSIKTDDGYELGASVLAQHRPQARHIIRRAALHGALNTKLFTTSATDVAKLNALVAKGSAVAGASTAILPVGEAGKPVQDRMSAEAGGSHILV